MNLKNYDSQAEDVSMETARRKAEKELIIEIRKIKNRLENSKLAAYHTIGTKIKGFYGKNYSNYEMVKIAKTIDLSRSTVYEVVQFAEKYNLEDVEEISEGRFQLSWKRLRDNLGLQKEEVLRGYRTSHSIAEFNRKIKQLKRVSKCYQEPDRFCPGVLDLSDLGSNKKRYETMKNLHMEITTLQSEIEQKNRQLDPLHKALSNRRMVWIARFPEILQDLDNEVLMCLESWLVGEIKRRVK